MMKLLAMIASSFLCAAAHRVMGRRIAAPQPHSSSSPRRREFLSSVFLAVGAAPLTALRPRPCAADVGDVLAAASRANQITYSQNGKNIQRMQSGDYSMGSKPTSSEPRALRRRATAACKSPKVLQQLGMKDEKECNIAVLDGDVASVIDALTALGDACKVDATHVCL